MGWRPCKFLLNPLARSTCASWAPAALRGHGMVPRGRSCWPLPDERHRRGCWLLHEGRRQSRRSRWLLHGRHLRRGWRLRRRHSGRTQRRGLQLRARSAFWMYACRHWHGRVAPGANHGRAVFLLLLVGSCCMSVCAPGRWMRTASPRRLGEPGSNDAPGSRRGRWTDRRQTTAPRNGAECGEGVSKPWRDWKTTRLAEGKPG
jgi:hypothetical protein